VKQITELDDPRLVKALAHPLRITILRVLQDRTASPSEIAEEISAPLGNVSYHVRVLERVAMVSATLDQAVRYVSAAAAAGGFDRRDANVSRRGMVLDKRGFAELAAAAKELLDRAYKIESESAKRIAASNHRNGEMNAGLVLMLFEAPPTGAEGVPAEHDPKRGSKKRAKQVSKT
jgi:DNA-binding transcriptional ArsR family regulator